jgi:hypothetical protein
MICKNCKMAADQNQQHLHETCSGKTWCDCQHRPIGTSNETKR